MTKRDGLLAIWSTVASEFETDYLHWLTREHVLNVLELMAFSRGKSIADAIVPFRIPDSVRARRCGCHGECAAYRERPDASHALDAG